MFTVIVWQAIVSVYVALALVHPLESVAVTVIENGPFWVGVPDRTPPAESDRPAGNVLAVTRTDESSSKQRIC